MRWTAGFRGDTTFRWACAIALVSVALLTAPAVGHGATYHASQDGTAADDCSQGAPCSLAKALINADLDPALDRIVIVGEFQHNASSQTLDLTKSQIELVGSGREAGGTVITGGDGLAVKLGSGSTLRNLRFDIPPCSHPCGSGISMAGGSALLDATGGIGHRDFASSLFHTSGSGTSRIVRSDLTLGNTQNWSGNLKITDSTIRSESLWQGGGVLTVRRSSFIGRVDIAGGSLRASSTLIKPSFDSLSISGSHGAATADLRQVTIVPGHGMPSIGLQVGAAANVTIVGSIIRGFDTDLYCGNGAAADSLTTLWSAFEELENNDGCWAGDGGSGILSGDPGFVDAPAGDFRLSSASPLIDKGQPGAEFEPHESDTDRSGDGRVRDGDGDGTARRDIGAFEYQPPSAPSSADGTGDAGSSADGGSGPETSVTPFDSTPTITGFSLARGRFAVGPATAAGLAKARAPVGTTFLYELSEPATARIQIQRRTRGRKAGSRCGRVTRRNRGRPRCTRYVGQGVLTHESPAGQTALPFTGRFGRRALRPGAYRATITATDAAGNRSQSSRATFTVVRR